MKSSKFITSTKFVAKENTVTLLDKHVPGPNTVCDNATATNSDIVVEDASEDDLIHSPLQNRIGSTLQNDRS